VNARSTQFQAKFVLAVRGVVLVECSEIFL
jgi:hypothetical protein